MGFLPQPMFHCHVGVGWLFFEAARMQFDDACEQVLEKCLEIERTQVLKCYLDIIYIYLFRESLCI